jgi:hypothetical protein
VKRLCALFVIGLFSAPAFAQADPGPTEARATMARFAQCVVARDAGRAARLVDLPVDSAEYRRVASRLFETTDETCLNDGGLAFNATLFTGAVFDALYTRDFRYGGPTEFAAGVTTSYAARYTAPLSATARQAVALEAFGECIARAEPVEARKLLLAAVGSAEENAQFAQLNARIAACVTKGSTVAMSKAIVRGALVEGMYRLSRAVAGGAR